MSGGFYCAQCGTCYRTPGSGLITCQRCGSIGLRGYNGKPPTRCRCPHEGCDWSGWNDKVNDDLGRHLRRAHPEATP